MGRGKSKARQTKVARDLKYATNEMDLEQLAKELHEEVSKLSNEKDLDPFSEGNPKQSV